MSALSAESRRARALLEQLARGGIVATTAAKISGGRRRTVNLLLRTGLAVLDEKPGHVVLRVTDDGRREIESWR